MTSKLNQRASSILAVIGIAVLLALIIMLWVLVGQGTFRKGGKVHHENIKTEDELYVMKPDHRTEEHSKEPKGRSLEMTLLYFFAHNPITAEYNENTVMSFFVEYEIMFNMTPR